ncbi:hypothetical protein CGI36_24830 [Vibrio parahaemolyticus]|nr:hypothetical protein CGI36_24830 [Vibrio parahaemolyticus]
MRLVFKSVCVSIGIALLTP